MTARPFHSKLAQLFHELSLREGLDLEHAIADSAMMFSRLGARAAPRMLTTSRFGGGAHSLARAERELARVTTREIERLCEQAADAQDHAAKSRQLRRKLCRLLLLELDCASSIECLPPSMLEHVRDLALHLARAACESKEFRAAAAAIRELPCAIDRP